MLSRALNYTLFTYLPIGRRDTSLSIIIFGYAQK